MVDGRSLAAKRNADQAIERALLADLEAFWSQVEGWDPVAVENALVELLPGLVDKYGSAYAEVAAQWFEALIGERPVLGESLRAEQVQRSVRWALRPYLQGAALDVARKRVAGSVVRHAKQAGRDTLDASVRQTPGVLYARRLRGPSNCDFCVVLASRGPVYGSRFSAGDKWQGNEFHDLCDCEIVPVRGEWVPDGSAPRGARWVGDDPGYDFEALYADEYKPFWRSGLSLDEVVARRADARAAAPWGGVTWLEDLEDSTATPPSWWDDTARKKTFIGHPSRKPGRWNGGHAYGQNIPGKTEFPERWTDDDDIDLILAETWENPTAVRVYGDRREARRVIDGVLVHVSASGDGFVDFRTYYPVGGRGVLYNGRSGRKQKRIPRKLDGWEIVNEQV